MRRSAFSLTAAITLVLLMGLSLALVARAQSYPPPVGSLTVAAPAATIGGTTNVTATVLDDAGNPVEGADVIFRIISQPGSDAEWAGGGLETTALTDSSGIATAVLSAGSAPGDIVIETVSGAKTSQVTVSVEETPPGGLPPTGASPDTDEGAPGWQIALMAAGAAALAGGLWTVARRNRRG